MVALSWEKRLVQDSRLDMEPLGRKGIDSKVLPPGGDTGLGLTAEEKLVMLQMRPQASSHRCRGKASEAKMRNEAPPVPPAEPNLPQPIQGFP